MRSRYTAFSLGLVDHLVRTLHPDHAERDLSPAALRQALSDTCASNRFLGLTVLASGMLDLGGSAPEPDGYVVFAARVFRRGVDVSFAERSVFGFVPGIGYCYRSGEGVVAPYPPDASIVAELSARAG